MPGLLVLKVSFGPFLLFVRFGHFLHSGYHFGDLLRDCSLLIGTVLAF